MHTSDRHFLSFVVMLHAVLMYYMSDYCFNMYTEIATGYFIHKKKTPRNE